MKVKICGITRIEDAECASRAGADFLGFVFYPKSPRYIAPADAGALIRQWRNRQVTAGRHLRTVGLCVGLTPDELARAATESGADLLQIYGTYAPETLVALTAPLFKTIRPATAEAALDEAGQFAPLAPAQGPRLLVDAFEPGAWGGTGKQTDWQLAAQLCRRYPRTLLAGGLNPQNVGTAIAQVQPWGVDVSSGVEAGPGIKDHAAVQAFVSNAKQAGQASHRG